MNRVCRVCGCIDDRACEGGCYWAADDLCSTCAPYLNIPQELRELRQWVGWKYINKPFQGKPAKVPFSPLSGKPASSCDASMWGTFEQALLAIDAYQLTGIGFMFANGIFGIDLDRCFDDNGVLLDFAQDMLDIVHSYTERSPSGTGLHILGKGTIPAGGRKKGNVEMYNEGRYFTVTGNQYGTEYPLLDCTESVKLAWLQEVAPPVVNEEKV